MTQSKQDIFNESLIFEEFRLMRVLIEAIEERYEIGEATGRKSLNLHDIGLMKESINRIHDIEVK